MISVETSRSGHPVLLKDGRFLGSSIDPVKDGQRWADERLEALKGLRAICVLGLGCAYHVKSLLAKDPQLTVLVVESDPKLAEQALRLFPEISPSLVCIESDWSQLLDHERVRALTHMPFAVFKHGPSCQSDSLFYQRAEALILARDRAGFFLQLRDRPALLRCVNRGKLEAVPVGPVSIKTVLEVLRPDAPDERELLIWKMLGELVK